MTTASVTPSNPRRELLRLRMRSTREFVGRFARRPDAVIGLAILIAFSVLALIPSLLVGPLETATTASGSALQAPDAIHVLGTDDLGRDILNLTVHGTRISMMIGFLATLVTIVIGTSFGIIAGYVGGATDAILMRITDFFLVLPTFVLALILAPIVLDLIGSDALVLGIRANLFVTVIVIGVTSWASTARIIRSQALSVRERMFVDRARVIGGSSGHIMRRHILPNVLNLIVANTVLTFAGAVLTETTLAFVGLGDPFDPSWGPIQNAAETRGAPGLGARWFFAPPAACVVLVVLAFTLVGGALDDVLNPRARLRR